MPDNFKLLADNYYVSPQLSADEVREAAALGFKLIVNNRPDGEMIGQPKSAEIEAAAHEAGMKYAFIPVGPSGISQSHIDALKSALAGVDQNKTLAFCRSGMRSTIVRSYLAAANGVEVTKIIADAANAGYDISSHLPVLSQLAEAE